MAALHEDGNCVQRSRDLVPLSASLVDCVVKVVEVLLGIRQVDVDRVLVLHNDRFDQDTSRG